MNSSPWTRNSVPPILWVACVTCGSWRTHSIRDRKRTSGETVSLARGDMGFQADKADSLDSIVKESEKGLKPERSPRTLRSKDRVFHMCRVNWSPSGLEREKGCCRVWWLG